MQLVHWSLGASLASSELGWKPDPGRNGFAGQSTHPLRRIGLSELSPAIPRVGKCARIVPLDVARGKVPASQAAGDTVMDAVSDDAVETEVSLAFGLRQAR
jgi:hypothetical protein